MRVMKMKRNVIYLDKKCKKSAYCDRNEYFKKYGQFSYKGDFKGMIKNAPIVINIDCTYYYFEKLVPLFRTSSIALENFERELKNPEKNNLLPPIFKWEGK